VRTHADTGMAVHRITAASISNATFLPQCMKVVSQFQFRVSTQALRAGVSLVTPRAGQPTEICPGCERWAAMRRAVRQDRIRTYSRSGASYRGSEPRWE
jgi:hypothetical protein